MEVAERNLSDPANPAEAPENALVDVPFDLARVVHAAIGPFAGRAAEKGLGLGVTIASDTPPFCRGDPVRLHQILANLLSNALKFTDYGTIQVEVRPCGAEHAPATLRFSVTDTGRGIPKGRIATIFEPSIQAEPPDTRRHGGVGLGLAVCKRLVGLMGGTIRAEADPGGGASFTFTAALPALDTLPAETPADGTTPSRALPARMLELGDFLAHTQAEVARLRKALDKSQLDRGSREAALRLVHQIRSHCLLAGLDRLARHAQNLERAVRADDEAQVPALLHDFATMLTGLEDACALSRGPPFPEEEAGEPAVRTLVADDHRLFRHGLRLLLTTEPGIVVVGEADDGISCLRLTAKLRSDIVVMDLGLPRMTGAEAIAALKRRHPGTRVLVLSTRPTEAPLVEALRAGADGVLLKTADRWALVDAIRALKAGERYVDESLSAALQEALRRGTLSQGEWSAGLSRRERQVLKLIVEGLRNREIGEQLAISAKTVEKHRASLMRKLGATNAAEVTALALREGLIAPT